MGEPTHIKNVLPSVMADIERRCKQNPDNRAFGVASHHKKVMAAVGDFHKSRKRIPKKKPVVCQSGNNSQVSLWS